MYNQITTVLLIALAVAFMVTAATCHYYRQTGEQRAKAAQEAAENWEQQARTYAETLERAEEARKRAEQSTREYSQTIEQAEAREHEARQVLDEMRKEDGNCVWLDERVPDGVRDIVRSLYARPDCDRDQTAGDAAGTVQSR